MMKFLNFTGRSVSFLYGSTKLFQEMIYKLTHKTKQWNTSGGLVYKVEKALWRTTVYCGLSVHFSKAWSYKISRLLTKFNTKTNHIPAKRSSYRLRSEKEDLRLRVSRIYNIPWECGKAYTGQTCWSTETRCEEPCSQEPYICPYPKQDKFSPYHPILSKIHFNIIHPSMSWSC
jgi:hypothetical protein